MKRKIILTIIIGVVVMTLSQTFALSPKGIDAVVQSKIESSPQLQNGEFNASGESLDMSFADNLKAAWLYFSTGNDRTPDQPIPSMPVDMAHFNGNKGLLLNTAWLGHSSILIHIDGYTVLTDPVFEKRVSLVGPTRFKGELPLAVDQLPRIDVVIISHDHYDHLNKWTVRQLKDKADLFIVPLAVGTRLVNWGVPKERIVELDWWEEHTLDGKLTIAATPAQHFSGRGIFDRNKTLWASWVIAGPAHKVFFSGDSGYFSGFKQIGAIYGPFDVTFLECGAYNRLWHSVHMLPEETAQAHLDLKGKVLHPIHWATFNLALHSWYDPMERITITAGHHKIDLATPIIGETIQYGQTLPRDRWWRQVMLNY